MSSGTALIRQGLRFSEQACREKTFLAVDDLLRETFGTVGAKSLYSYLERNRSIRQEECHDKPAQFFDGLEEILGTGSVGLKRMLWKRLQEEPEMDHCTFLLELSRLLFRPY